MIVISTVVAVIPGVPVITLLVGVQVVNGVLPPINLFFIWRLARSPELWASTETAARSTGSRQLRSA